MPTFDRLVGTNINGDLPDVVNASLNARYAAQAQALLPQSTNIVGYVGDSITVGSGASANKNYPAIARWAAGTRVIDQVFRQYATAGHTSAQVLATHVPSAVAGDAAVVHVQVGTNDAGASVAVATFAANVIAIYDALRAAGKRMTIGTVPPRASAAGATFRTYAGAYNEWIMRWAPLNGVPIANVHGAVVDSSGYLASAYDSGDGTHMNDLGYARIAQEVAAAIRQALPAQPHRYTRRTGVNLMPLTATPTTVASGLPSGWAEKSGGTGTAPTFSTVADTGGTLVEGVWVQMDWNAATGGTRTFKHGGLTKDTGWGVTDQIEGSMAFEVEDVSGFAAALAAGTATIRLLVLNTSDGAQVEITPTMRTTPGKRHAFRFLGPNTSFPSLAVEVTVPAGVHVKVRMSELAWVNLTTLGLVKATS